MLLVSVLTLFLAIALLCSMGKVADEAIRCILGLLVCVCILVGLIVAHWSLQLLLLLALLALPTCFISVRKVHTHCPRYCARRAWCPHP